MKQLSFSSRRGFLAASAAVGGALTLSPLLPAQAASPSPSETTHEKEPKMMKISGTATIEVDGLKVRYLRGGAGRGIPVVLTSPWPESLFAFDRIWPRLATEAPLVAIDLPGFGHSEGRADLMSPVAMGGFLPKIFTALGLDRLHAVCPDVGTSAALFAAAAHPKLFESLVVGSGGIDPALATGPLKEIIHAPSTQQFEGMNGEDFAANAIGKMMKDQPTPEVLDDFKRASAGRRFIAAMAYVRAYPADLPKLRDKFSAIRTPVLSIWGKNDPLVSPANADVLDKGLPRTRSIELNAGHFTWEDQPTAYADAVAAWIHGDYRAA